MAQYSDQAYPQEMAAPGDYDYPSALRIDSTHRYLFGLAQGYRPIGKTPVTLLFQFDIQRRELVHTFDLTPGVITNEPAPAP